MADRTPVITVVGAETLLGREVVDVLGAKSLRAQVKLVSAAEPEESTGGIMTEHQGEAVFLAALQAGELTGSSIIILAGSKEAAANVLATRKEADGPVLVDLTGALEDDPAARLRAPMAEQSSEEAASSVVVIAHPAAIAFALFLKQVVKASPIRRIVGQVFEPVSERGKRGLDELQQQTVGLLSFQKLKKEVFDTQVSFNMLPAYGEDATRSLEDVESSVERHLATLLSTNPEIRMPSLRVVHAPVFHGYSFSVWVEFENRPDAAALASALANDNIDVRQKDQEAPSNVGVAGQSGITVGSIVPDRNDARATWFWIVADNLRIAADNAVEVVRELLK